MCLCCSLCQQLAPWKQEPKTHEQGQCQKQGRAGTVWCMSGLLLPVSRYDAEILGQSQTDGPHSQNLILVNKAIMHTQHTHKLTNDLQTVVVACLLNNSTKIPWCHKIIYKLKERDLTWTFPFRTVNKNMGTIRIVFVTFADLLFTPGRQTWLKKTKAYLEVHCCDSCPRDNFWKRIMGQMDTKHKTIIIGITLMARHTGKNQTYIYQNRCVTSMSNSQKRLVWYAN